VAPPVLPGAPGSEGVDGALGIFGAFGAVGIFGALKLLEGKPGMRLPILRKRQLLKMRNVRVLARVTRATGTVQRDRRMAPANTTPHATKSKTMGRKLA
jgi:hypothetical protein